jgi:hypothetical protein
MIELAGAAAELGGARSAVRPLGVDSVGEHAAAGCGALVACLSKQFFAAGDVLLGPSLHVLLTRGEAGPPTPRVAEATQELQTESFVAPAPLPRDELNGHVDAGFGGTEHASTLEERERATMIDGAVHTEVVPET